VLSPCIVYGGSEGVVQVVSDEVGVHGMSGGRK